MKTKTLLKNKVNVVTLGCSKNIVDSEVLMGQLKANQFTVEHESERDDASIVIINTCGFIEMQTRKYRYNIEVCGRERKGAIDKLLVTGCLSERYAKDLKRRFRMWMPGLVRVICRNFSKSQSGL